MRHLKKFNHLGRTADHRNAMLANMAIGLIMHKRITTTLTRAKALKQYVEPLITRCKSDTTNSRRVVFRHLQNKYAVTELFKTIAPRIGDRPGGYTRIIKLGIRPSDAAKMAFIELVDFDENMAKTPKTAKKTRRSRRKKSVENAPAEAIDQQVKTEEAETSEEKSAEKPEAEEQTKTDKKEESPKSEKEATVEEQAPEAEKPQQEEESK